MVVDGAFHLAEAYHEKPSEGQAHVHVAQHGVAFVYLVVHERLQHRLLQGVPGLAAEQVAPHHVTLLRVDALNPFDVFIYKYGKKEDAAQVKRYDKRDEMAALDGDEEGRVLQELDEGAATF